MEFISNIQKNIVLSKSNLKLINGCAGSRKTDTLVKCAIHNISNSECGNVLFLTLVSSVTDELKNRLQNTLKINISRQGGSNHYIGKLNNNYIQRYGACFYVLTNFLNKTTDDY